MNIKFTILIIGLLALVHSGYAKTDLATVPTRDTVQLTIYNSADLTLVRETRLLTIRKGTNKLQFSWANTLIDPTSLEMKPLKNGDKIEVDSLVFPPRTKELGLWKVNSEYAGQVPFEITYFTSGISWRAFYMGTLSDDETSMRLQGYVRATNNSGEDYEDAQTRLIVGKVQLLDQIATLARRQHPYGSPRPRPMPSAMPKREMSLDRATYARAKKVTRSYGGGAKQIKKEGLSEYFLYTIEGTETIPTKWSKRLPSFEAGEVPVKNLYKYEEERYGTGCTRFLSFKNDKKHKLGETPIPGGALKVYRNVDEQGHLSYEGTSSFKYIPVAEDVELNLGRVSDVIVEPKVMSIKKENFRFNHRGDIAGWDEIKEFKVAVKNTRGVAAKVEITRNFPSKFWELKHTGETGEYKKIDLDTGQFTLELPAHSTKTFTYILRIYHGTRQENR
ncbi:hypothetical protein BVY04_03470 [bacterium M21]|nr:hypothetical protein BVY04_03470 [bacterium M21]